MEKSENFFRTFDYMRTLPVGHEHSYFNQFFKKEILTP